MANNLNTVSSHENKILYYSKDNRININEVQNYREDLRNAVIEQTKSIGIMIHESHFSVNPHTGVHTLNTRSLKERVAQMRDEEGNLKYSGYPLAEDEKFKNEQACGFGTLFVVDAGSQERSPSALTAAHCVCLDESDVLDEQKIADTRIIFNFKLDTNGNLKTRYNEEEVFKIKKVSSRKFVSIKDKPEERIDWAWLKLDKPFN